MTDTLDRVGPCYCVVCGREFDGVKLTNVITRPPLPAKDGRDQGLCSLACVVVHLVRLSRKPSEWVV